MPTMPGYCGSMLEKSSTGSGGLAAASMVKWGKAQTGTFTMVRSGRAAASSRATATAVAFE